MDRLSALLMRFGYTATTFFQGAYCGTSSLNGPAGAGHLHLVRAGRVSFHQSSAPTLHVSTPTLVFYPRPCPHQLQAAPGAVLLCASIVPRGDAPGLIERLPPVVAMPLAQLPALAATLALLLDEADSKAPGRLLVLNRLFDVLIVQLLRELLSPMVDGPDGLGDHRLSPALLAMKAQPQHDWPVAQLAQCCGMSRSKFASQFHAVVGVTPADFLVQQRIAMAKSLLRQGRQVQQVATLVGYASQPGFSRAFERVCRVSPRAWLRAQAPPAGADGE